MMFNFKKISLFTALVFVFTACGEKGDTTAPVITLKGASPMEITLGEVYREKGAIANDDNDGTIKVSIDTSNLNTGKIGSYQVKYTAKDKSNNSRTIVRTVIVVAKDTTKPVITITTPATVKEGESFNATATAEDDKDGILTVTIAGDTVNEVTPPGTYTITYRAEDKAGNIAQKSKSVTVKALTVTELLTAAAKGREGVHYHVVGDSTRNYPDKGLTKLVDDYYPNQLDNIGIHFEHTAMGGQRAYKWLSNKSDSPRFNYNDTNSSIPNNNHYVEQRNYILEFSLGINDARDHHYNDVLKTIRKSISTLKRDHKYMKILLVSPVPHEQDGRYVSGDQFEEIYAQVAKEFNLPWVSGKKALQDKFENEHSKYYEDSVHPNAEGSWILFNYIFQHIATPDTYNQIMLKE